MGLHAIILFREHVVKNEFEKNEIQDNGALGHSINNFFSDIMKLFLLYFSYNKIKSLIQHNYIWLDLTIIIQTCKASNIDNLRTDIFFTAKRT